MSKAHYPSDPTDKDENYAKKFMSPDEELELITGYGRVYLRQRFIVQILLPGAIFILIGTAYAYFTKANIGYGMLVGLIVACVFSFMKTMKLRMAHKYILTTRRLIVKEGLFNIKVSSTLYDKITHIEIDQSLVDRLIYHHGTLVINTAGGGDKDRVILHYVEAPVEFKSILERLVHEERRYLIEESGSVNLRAINGEEV